MPLLTAHALTHAFGDNDLINEISLKIENREHIGLIGPNGVGKSTLLQILGGLIEADEGEIHQERDLSLGYLHQEAALTFSGQRKSIYEEMLSVFQPLIGLEAEMRQLEARMSDGDMSTEVVNRYSDAQIEYDALGGYAYQHEIKRVLEGLGFPQETWQSPINQLSGGQKTRVLLGRLLLEKPALLILDEPTNHLDASAVGWLEKQLKQWPGALLTVSHDRYFLDRTVNRVWEMSVNGLAVYKGNYSSYLTQREAAFDREQKLFEAEYERLSKELEFIRRHIAGGKHDMAKGKLRRLTRDIVLIEEVGLTGREGKSWLEIGGRVRTFSPNEAAQRLKGLQPPDNRPPRLNIRLDSNEKSGELVLKTQRLRIGYDSKFLFKTEKIKLERLECAAIIGPNGSGKSTFLKTLLREVPPLKGKIDYGDNLQVGYFAQAHEQLDPEKGVIEELLYRFDIGENQARAHLAQYLFKGHDVFKQVKDLSGGERGRLALAILSLEEANLLLLDEPTNHLDISSQEVLQEVLETYDGTILLVSHDRYLVSRLATQIWEIRDEELFVFDGSYEAYLGEVAVYQSGQTPLDKGGEKLSVRTEDQTTASQAVPDVSWVNELAVDVNPTVEQTLPTRKSDRGRARGHLETYLDKLYEELEIAELAGEEDEVAWLQEEITITEQKLG